MKNILITGSDGFIGKNLRLALSRIGDVNILTFDINDDNSTLKEQLRQADIIYHLAGVNRPKDEHEFEKGNAGLTQAVVNELEKLSKTPTIIMTSSTQAEQNNPYGKSKKHAETILKQYAKDTHGQIHIYRLTNVFGKWCRPNYNSVVATFCYNISHGMDITISDKNRLLELVYIDDVVAEFCRYINNDDYRKNSQYCDVANTYKITLGDLANKIYQLRDMRSTLIVPDLSDEFMKCLHSTYISYLDKNKFSYPLDMKKDNRGFLAELIKSECFGQIFISKTNKGVLRGNHYHDSKVEKFCVIQGDAKIRFRHVLNHEIITYNVSDEKIKIVDIPTGYTHSIENMSDEEMIVLFWANEIFDNAKPDTFYEEV